MWNLGAIADRLRSRGGGEVLAGGKGRNLERFFLHLDDVTFSFARKRSATKPDAH